MALPPPRLNRTTTSRLVRSASFAAWTNASRSGTAGSETPLNVQGTSIDRRSDVSGRSISGGTTAGTRARARRCFGTPPSGRRARVRIAPKLATNDRRPVGTAQPVPRVPGLARHQLGGSSRDLQPDEAPAVPSDLLCLAGPPGWRGLVAPVSAFSTVTGAGTETVSRGPVGVGQTPAGPDYGLGAWRWTPRSVAD
jgi:hypothetical protein